MTNRARILVSIGLTAWALAGGGGCGWWTWGEQPLVIVTEDDCDGALVLLEWSHGNGPNRTLADGLAAGDCVEGFDRARYHDLYLWCRAAPITDATSGLIVPQLGQRGEALRDSCQRIVVAATPPE